MAATTIRMFLRREECGSYVKIDMKVFLMLPLLILSSTYTDNLISVHENSFYYTFSTLSLIIHYWLRQLLIGREQFSRILDDHHTCSVLASFPLTAVWILVFFFNITTHYVLPITMFLFKSLHSWSYLLPLTSNALRIKKNSLPTYLI